MTDEQIARVKRSFSGLMPCADRLATHLYDRLFEADPSLRPMFGNDMTEQRRKLMLTLSTVVYELNNLTAILPDVEDLARRHVSYGVESRHYALVGAALLDAIQEVGGFSGPEDRTAWSVAYDVLSRAMIAAAYPPTASRAAA